MIGSLPTALEVGGRLWDIRTDIRVVLGIFQAFNDPELTDREKAYVCVKCLYADLDDIPAEDMQEAVEKAFWFCNGGDTPKEEQDVKVIDWEHDEHIIFPAISRALGVTDIRSLPYMHWWTFCGAFGELPESSVLSTVISLRRKMGRHEKLEKYEQDIIRKNRALIDMPKRLTAEEQAEDDFVDSLFY